MPRSRATRAPTGTLRTARRMSSPPGRARRAAAPSRELQLPLVVTWERGRPLDAAQHDLVPRAATARRDGCLGADRAPDDRLDERVGEEHSRAPRLFEADLAEARERGRRRRDPDGRLRQIG